MIKIIGVGPRWLAVARLELEFTESNASWPRTP